MSAGNDAQVAVLGAGMHEWGKWGRPFVEYGLAAARDALDDAGLGWRDVQFVSGADTIRNGYPGFVSGATFAQALGWTGARVSSVYAACASGAVAIANARAQILAGLCDVALVVGADTTPKGFFTPVGGERKDDPDWLRFHLLGATNPTYFALYARRRMDRFGATEEDFARVKVKNARHGVANPNARYRKEVSVDEVLASPMVADPLRLLEICATSDGGAALVLSSMEFARRHGGASPLVTIDAVSTVTPVFPNTVIEMPNFSTDSAVAFAGDGAASGPGSGAGASGFRPSIATAAYAEAGIGPDDVDLAEVYDLSSALELDWYEDIGLCGEGEAEKLLRDGATGLGGRVPVNPSGGLSCFGEAIPAQAIAQVCECVWQLRGTASGRQVEGATVAVTANQGLFGHGSSVLLSR
jgi:acetyl-CoA acetyltransferase